VFVAILTSSTLDINTLARMTGKDFSGPTPVIRMPTPLVSIENPENVESGAEKEKDKAAPTASAKRKKKSKKQELAPDEEIVGRTDSFVDSDD
jgi:transcription factor TFIIIB component B''